MKINISKNWCLNMAAKEGEAGDPDCAAGILETPLVKELRDQAARETKDADNPFEARKSRVEWRAAAEIARLTAVVVTNGDRK